MKKGPNVWLAAIWSRLEQIIGQFPRHSPIQGDVTTILMKNPTPVITLYIDLSRIGIHLRNPNSSIQESKDLS
jgi:hypothetical protein